MNNNTIRKEAQEKGNKSDTLEFVPDPNRPYDFMWDMYLDEFEDYEEGAQASEYKP